MDGIQAVFLSILYNCMDRDIPTFNQLVVNKIHQKNRQLHEQRLHNIRTSQNSRTYVSSSLNNRQNLKAQQLEQDKKTEIQKHNAVLFNRMKKIMKRDDPYNKPVLQNNKNYNRLSMELTKIEEQNRTMYNRIQKQRPTINNKKLYEERQKQLNVLKFLGKYSAHSIQSVNAQNQQNLRSSQASNKTQTYMLPEARKKAYTSKPQHYLQNNDGEIYSNTNTRPRYQQIQFDEEINDQDFDQIKQIMQAKKHKQKSALEHRHQREYQEESKAEVKVLKNTTTRPSVPVTAKDIILYKNTKEIDSQLYEVKILRKHLTYEIRCSLVGSCNDPIFLQLAQQEGNLLLQQTNYNYKAIIDSLHLINNTIILGNYQSQQYNGGMLKCEPTDIIPQIKKRQKNPFLYGNPSHISQQNQEDSYQVQVIPRKKPADLEQLDSLGEEQQFENYTAQQLKEMNNGPHFQNSHANFQQKLQYFSQKNHFQNPILQQANRYEVQPTNYRQTQNEGKPSENNHYQQALDQSID